MALSSFVNVTLSFWTNEKGLSITPEDYQSQRDYANPVSSSAYQQNTIAHEPKEETSEINSKSSAEFLVKQLMNDLWRDNRPLESNSTLDNGDIMRNLSILTKKLIDNGTAQANDTFRCLTTDPGTNDCLWANDTEIRTNITFGESKPEKVYWALFLVLLPVLALFGNILVILSVYRERSLQTVTNWFIVSLGFADLFVTIPMVFSLYVLVNVDWELSELLCDVYIAIDVICSTASIFNLVAISFDRYIAVTHPIFYSKHKNDKRVIFTIVIVWFASAGVGLPIMLGANSSPVRVPELCIFYNSNFIIYSSLWSFYVPCVIMVLLYYKIFKAIHDRARKSIGSRKTYTNTGSDTTKSVPVIDNASLVKKPHETLTPTGNMTQTCPNSKPKPHLPLITETDAITNTGSGSQDEEDEEDKDEPTFDAVECHIIRNIKTDETEYMLNVTRGTHRCVTPLSPEVEITIGPNGNTNTDSGYAPSNVEETQFCLHNPQTESAHDRPSSPIHSKSDTAAHGIVTESTNKNGTATKVLSTKTSTALTIGHNHRHHDRHSDSVSHSGSTTASTGAVHNVRPKKKSRFNLGRKHKSSRKKREKASAKRERKATKTLAIVLGVFLLCWTPFFSCNILEAICIKLHENKIITTDCHPGMTAFLLTTWLGYMNSCLNPLIYTIFNPEFRKAFRKILVQSFARKQ